MSAVQPTNYPPLRQTIEGIGNELTSGQDQLLHQTALRIVGVGARRTGHRRQPVIRIPDVAVGPGVPRGLDQDPLASFPRIVVTQTHGVAGPGSVLGRRQSMRIPVLRRPHRVDQIGHSIQSIV